MPKHVDTNDARLLLERGAQAIEVLPRGAYEKEHLPGAVNVPFTELDAARVADLDPKQPTVVYCYDYECDLSARAAHRLETLGFTDVYDYGPSKVDWLARRLPVEGTVPDAARAGAVAHEPPTCRLDASIADIARDLATSERVVVTTDGGVVLGVVRASVLALPGDTAVADVMQGAPPSVRPSITAEELAASMDRDQRPFVLVTDPDGVLFGVIERADLLGRP